MQSDFAGKQFAKAVLMVGVLALASRSDAADRSLPVTGNLLGSVLDDSGTPQMGASVLLFNRYENLVARALTNPEGRFAFANLPLDTYSLRVSLASFLPAFRQRIAVKPGLDSILEIHLATLFSSVEVSYSLPTSAMSDDWKWVLRSSPATRPITRYLPDERSSSSSAELRPRVFSGTHAMLAVSGGDGGLLDSDSAQTDLGTQFALSTSLMGKNQLQLAGNYGERPEFGPAAFGLCAIYSRDPDGAFGNPPEVTFSMSQLGSFGAPLGGSQYGGASGTGNAWAVLRTSSLSVYEVADPFDTLHLEYGMSAQAVDYLQHASRISPFVRASLGFGEGGEVVAAYSDGGRPDELTAHQQYQAQAEADAPADDLVTAVNALARIPEISSRGGELELQRTASYELGYRKHAGSRTYGVSVFEEQVSNGRINVAGDLSPLDSGDLLWDGMSKTSTYNIGNYARMGYIASLNQHVRDSVDIAVVYGRMGGFLARAGGLNGSGGVQQDFLEEGQHNVASVNLSAKVPVSGTRITASYGWMDNDAVIPGHVFTTQTAYIAPGLNFGVRQPLPSFFGLPGRLELTAELRNLLAQGYIPLEAGEGRTLLVVQSPRALRGGLNFTF